MSLNKDYAQHSASKAPYLHDHPDLSSDDAPQTLRLTVMSVQPLRQGTAALVEFREFPGWVIWITKGDLVAACDQLGTEDDAWPGRVMALERVRRNNPRTGVPVTKYVPVSPDAAPEPPRRVRRRRHQ